MNAGSIAGQVMLSVSSSEKAASNEQKNGTASQRVAAAAAAVKLNVVKLEAGWCLGIPLAKIEINDSFSICKCGFHFWYGAVASNEEEVMAVALGCKGVSRGTRYW